MTLFAELYTALFCNFVLIKIHSNDFQICLSILIPIFNPVFL